MFANLRGWEWLVILLLVVLLFGAKKLPETARGLGRSLRIFKAETKSLHDDDDQPADEAPVAQQQQPVQQVQPQLPPAQQAPVTAPPQQQAPYTPGPVGPRAQDADPAPYDR